MLPVFYIQPFHTRCLDLQHEAANSLYLPKQISIQNVTETDAKYKLGISNPEKQTQIRGPEI